MTLSYRVNGEPHDIEIPEWGELPEMLTQLHDEVVETCRESKPDPFLQSRLYIAALHALVDQNDFDLGEVVSVGAGDSEES